MEVAFRSGTLAKVARCDGGRCAGRGEALEFKGVGGTGGLWDLCREGGGDCVLGEKYAHISLVRTNLKCKEHLE